MKRNQGPVLCTEAGSEVLKGLNVVREHKRGFGGLEVACWPLIPKLAG